MGWSAKTKTDYKKAINLLQEVLDLEKKKLDKWVNIPTYYQYDIDTNLISQIGFAAAGYKSLSDNKKTIPEAKAFRRCFSTLSIWKEFIYN